MNENDRDYIYGLMVERMSHHVEQQHYQQSEKFKTFSQLEEKLNGILDTLTSEQAQTIRDYIQLSFERNIDKQELFFKKGFLDGFKLGMLAHELTTME